MKLASTKFLLFTTYLLVTIYAVGQKHSTYDSLLTVLETELGNLPDLDKKEILKVISKEHASMDSSESIFYVNKSSKLADDVNFPPLKITALHAYARHLKKLDLEEELFKQTLRLSEDYDYLKGKADALFGLGEISARRYENEKAIQLCQASAKLNLKLGNDLDVPDIYRIIATIYSNMGNYEKANEYILKVLDIGERLGSERDILSSYISLGAVHFRQNNFETALNYYLKGKEMAEQLNDKKLLSYAQNNLGSLFIELKQYDKAMKSHREALRLRKELNMKSGVGYSLYFLAACHFHQHSLDSALLLAEESLDVFRETESVGAQTYPMIVMGQVYTELGDWSNAKYYLSTAKEKAMDIGFKENIKISAEYLARVEAALGNYKAAYENHILHKQVYDSMFNESNLKAMTKLEAEYMFEKEKDSIQFANAQEKLVMDQTLQRERNRQYAAIIGLGVLLLIIYILYRYYRSKQRANKLLQLKNREIEQKNTELASLDKAKSSFFANISHELRTPLTLISGPLENLAQKRAYDDSIVQMALRNTKKLKGLVNDILDLSKLESSKPEVQKASVNIKTLINRIFSNYSSLAEELGIKYSLELSDKLSVWHLLDAACLEKIINNILSNAIKYTEAGGEITMKVSGEEGQLVISVSDTGQGIAEEDLAHIFDRYFQSKQPDAPIQGGTGIGLALARELALLMEGNLTVESKLGLGSTFKLGLPLRLAEAPAKIQPEDTFAVWIDEESGIYDQPVATTPFGEKKRKVLVAEDNHDMQVYIKQMLEGHYDVSLAINGKKALSKLEEQDFDLVVTDAMMPGMDGFALLERIKQDDRYAHIPVVMLTALKLEGSKLRALTIGVDDYLTKPFSPPELLARVRNLILRYEALMTARLELSSGELSESPPDQKKAQNVIYKSDHQWLKEVETVVSMELVNSDYQITNIADHFHLSKRQFQRKLKLLTGMTYTEYHHEMSLQKAREFLENSTYGNVTGVGYAVGINNPSRFSEMYYNRFGKKPIEYFKERIES